MSHRKNEEWISTGWRVGLRRFRRDDVERMQAWRPYEEPLFLSYNIPRGSRRHSDAWYERNVLRSGKRYFSVVRLQDRQLIGVISLREIRRRGRPSSARLGITLGADYVDQRYGTEALVLFLDYFFGPLGFGLMKLDVAAYNRRAVRVYEKCGFRRSGMFYRSASGVQYNPDVVSRDRAHFVQHRGQVLTLHYEMDLLREQWQARRPSVVRALKAELGLASVAEP